MTRSTDATRRSPDALSHVDHASPSPIAAADGTATHTVFGPSSRGAKLAPGLALAFGVAGIALAVNLAVPTLSALLVAILLGIIATNTGTLPASATPGLAVASKQVLRIGIVLLGLQLSLQDIVALGPGMLLVVVGVVAGGITTAEVVGRALRVCPAQRSLIGAGFSICGAAAVAGVEGVVEDRKEEDVVTAVALVVLFGTLMIPAVPLCGGWLGLDPVTHGLWAGASIHEVAQVVAAAGIIGGGALEVAVVVKLARVLMLAPAMLWFGWWSRSRSAATGAPGSERADGHRAPLVPLFVVGFVAAAALRTTGFIPTGVLSAAATTQTVFLAAAMFGLGCGVKASTIRKVGARPVVLAAVTTVVVASIALAGVLLAS